MSQKYACRPFRVNLAGRAAPQRPLHMLTVSRTPSHTHTCTRVLTR